MFCLVEGDLGCSEVDVSVHRALWVGCVFSTCVVLRLTDLQDCEENRERGDDIWVFWISTSLDKECQPLYIEHEADYYPSSLKGKSH